MLFKKELTVVLLFGFALRPPDEQVFPASGLSGRLKFHVIDVYILVGHVRSLRWHILVINTRLRDRLPPLRLIVVRRFGSER